MDYSFLVILVFSILIREVNFAVNLHSITQLRPGFKMIIGRSKWGKIQGEQENEGLGSICTIWVADKKNCKVQSKCTVCTILK